MEARLGMGAAAAPAAVETQSVSVTPAELPADTGAAAVPAAPEVPASEIDAQLAELEKRVQGNN